MTDPPTPTGIAGLKPYQRKVVRETFRMIRDQAGPVSLMFYGKLFELAPETRRLFQIDMAAQGKKLMATLEVVVESLDHFEALRDKVRELGRQHAEYGVKPADYDTVLAAINYTFAHALGPDFDAAAREAWRVILTEVSDVMRTAS
jgi:hemoglobin-like flavoprotein